MHAIVCQQGSRLSIETIIFFGVGLYLVIMLVIGIYASRKSGIPKEIDIYGAAVVLFIYTVAGSMRAVALTDFVQMVIIAIGLVSLLIAIVQHANGGTDMTSACRRGSFTGMR